MKESSKVLPGIVPGEDPERVTLTVDEVAALLGVHKLTVYAAVKAGDIPSIRIGNRILIPRARLEDMLNGTV